jgi:hypothetical protein
MRIVNTVRTIGGTLPDESKNVIHKNEANVLDPSQFIHQKIYITYPRCMLFTLKQKRFYQNKFSVSSPCPTRLLSCRVGLS